MLKIGPWRKGQEESVEWLETLFFWRPTYPNLPDTKKFVLPNPARNLKRKKNAPFSGNSNSKSRISHYIIGSKIMAM